MNFNGKENRAQYIANKKASATSKQSNSQFFEKKIVLPNVENRAINNYRCIDNRIIKRR